MKLVNIILLIFVIFLVGCLPIKNCETNLSCFREETKTCSRSKVYLNHEGNMVRLTLRGLEDDGCKVSLKIEEISPEIKEKYPTESFIAEGKTLNCNLPLNIDYFEAIVNIEERFDESCSGPIKDIMQGPLKNIVKKELNQLMK